MLLKGLLTLLSLIDCQQGPGKEPGKTCESYLRTGMPAREVYAARVKCFLERIRCTKAMLEVAHRFPEHGVQLRSACLRGGAQAQAFLCP